MTVKKKISIVIIGLNVEYFLEKSIQAILNMNYPKELYEIIYVDSGSIDNSISLAKNFKQVRIIPLKDPYPTPGKARNSGWKAANYDLIQFLDADSIIDPNWLISAVDHLKGNVIALSGYCDEVEPKRNFFHLIGDIEWDNSPSIQKAFGGNVLINKASVKTLGGYDETLIAGEDPELSYRVREQGGQILRLDSKMVKHDINMSKLQQYLKRTFRTGYGFAEVAMKHIHKEEKLWLRELIRIPIQVFLPWTALLISYMLEQLPVGIALTALLFFRPMWKIFKFKSLHKLNLIEAIIYALHLSLVVYPQFAGIIRYLYAQITGNKLRNQGSRISLSKLSSLRN